MFTSTTDFSLSKNDAVTDLVTKNLKGTIIKNWQVKDVSPQNVGKIARQVSSGKYASTELIGSSETAEAYNKIAEAKNLPKMTDSKISSDTTRNLAQRSGVPQKLKLDATSLVKGAHQSGMSGAQIGAGVAVVKGVYDLASGNKDIGEVSSDVVVAGAKGYSTAFAATTAATATTALGTAVIGAGVMTTVAAPIAVAAVTAYVAGEIFDEIGKPILKETIDLAGDAIGGTFDLASDVIGGTLDVASDTIGGVFGMAGSLFKGIF
jgi:hypothetical protein